MINERYERQQVYARTRQQVYAPADVAEGAVVYVVLGVVVEEVADAAVVGGKRGPAHAAALADGAARAACHAEHLADLLGTDGDGCMHGQILSCRYEHCASRRR